MESYLLMLYVTVDQETAIKLLFNQNKWSFRKGVITEKAEGIEYDNILPKAEQLPVHTSVNSNEETSSNNYSDTTESMQAQSTKKTGTTSSTLKSSVNHEEHNSLSKRPVGRPRKNIFEAMKTATRMDKTKSHKMKPTAKRPVGRPRKRKIDDENETDQASIKRFCSEKDNIKEKNTSVKKDYFNSKTVNAEQFTSEKDHVKKNSTNSKKDNVSIANSKTFTNLDEDNSSECGSLAMDVYVDTDTNSDDEENVVHRNHENSDKVQENLNEKQTKADDSNVCDTGNVIYNSVHLLLDLPDHREQMDHENKKGNQTNASDDCVDISDHEEENDTENTKDDQKKLNYDSLKHPSSEKINKNKSLVVKNLSNKSNSESSTSSKQKSSRRSCYSPRTYKKYNVKQKLEMVEQAKLHGVRQTARKLNISKSTLAEWMTIDFTDVNRGENGDLSRPGRPVSYEDQLDINIAKYVEKQRDLHRAITVDELCKYAADLIQPLTPQFQASHHWAQGFIKRHKFTLGVTDNKDNLDKITDTLSDNKDYLKNIGETLGTNFNQTEKVKVEDNSINRTEKEDAINRIGVNVAINRADGDVAINRTELDIAINRTDGGVAEDDDDKDYLTKLMKDEDKVNSWLNNCLEKLKHAINTDRDEVLNESSSEEKHDVTDRKSEKSKKSKHQIKHSSKHPKRDIKRKIIHCVDCKVTFTSQKRFDGHKQKNGGKCVFECEYCGKVFLYRKSKYLLHIRSAHTKVRPFVCDTCGKGYVTSDKLKIHKRTHTGDKPCVCEQCGKSFYSRADLSIHIDYHHVAKQNIDTLTCPICNIVCCSKRYLEYHKNVTHSDRRDFLCTKCHKQFKCKSTLQRHLKDIHVDVLNYKCNLCEKSFKTLSSLKKHIIRHGGEKQFFCNECNKGFYEKAKLIQHTRTHSGEKPYKCDQCDYRCSLSGNLNKHKKIHIKLAHGPDSKMF